MNIENVYRQICAFAEKQEAKKVVLFGSRARGDHQEKSDIDLAVYGCPNFDRLKDQLDNELWSLLELDVLNMDAPSVSEELKKEIARDGRILCQLPIT